MSQTGIGLALLSTPLVLAVIFGGPALWAWWRDNEAGRLAVVIALWAAFTWRETVILAPWYDRLVRPESALAGTAFLALLYGNGWLAHVVSLLPRYWRAQRLRRPTWQRQMFDNYRL